MTAPSIVLHVLEPSHPCHTAEAALRLKGLEFERVVLRIGDHFDPMLEIYGEGNKTVPGMTVDGEAVHGTAAILRRVDELVGDPPFFPAAIATEVAAACTWAEGTFQDIGRRLPWAALHFRPEAMGTMVSGGQPLDPAGTDFAMKFIRGPWKRFGISATTIAEDLRELVGSLDRIEGLVEAGLAGQEQPTALDLHIGATLQLLRIIGDVRPVIDERPWVPAVTRWFARRPGDIPAGAFPAAWVPTAA